MSDACLEKIVQPIEKRTVLENKIESADQQNMHRSIFFIVNRLGKFAISFRGREELPTLPENSISQLNIVLGRKPAHVPEQHFDEWKRRQHSRDGTGDYIFLSASHDVLSLYQLLMLLSEDTSLHQELQKRILRVSKWEYTHEDWGILDFILHRCMHDQKQYSGDAIVEFIMQILNASSPLQELQQFYAEDRNRLSETECKQYAGIPVFHVTKKYPNIQGDTGKQSDRFTGSLGALLRNSFHVALNRPVEAHLLNSWDDKPYILVSDLGEILQANGTPYAGYDQDTWWLQSPGEAFLFPNVWIIEPQAIANEKYPAFLVSGRKILIKREKYSTNDIQQILQLEKNLTSISFLNERPLFSRIEMQIFDPYTYQVPRDERFHIFYEKVKSFFEYIQTNNFSFNSCRNFLERQEISFTHEQYKELEKIIYLFLRDIAAAFASKEIQNNANHFLVSQDTQIPDHLFDSKNSLGCLHNAYPHANTIALTNLYDTKQQKYIPRAFRSETIQTYDIQTQRCFIESGIFSTATNAY